MSDTPRTDVLLIAHDMAPTHISLISHSRELERELNAANQRIKRLKEAGDDIFLLAQKHAPEYWLYTQTAFNNWKQAKEAKP